MVYYNIGWLKHSGYGRSSDYGGHATVQKGGTGSSYYGYRIRYDLGGPNPYEWQYDNGDYVNRRTGERIDAAYGADALRAIGWIIAEVSVDEFLEMNPIVRELGEQGLWEDQMQLRAASNIGYGMSFDGDPKNIDWDMVLSGAITTTGGTLMMIGGGVALATGVGAPAGGVALTFGAPTFGFGLAKLIDGFQGGNQELPSGFFEATGEGFGGDGSFGQVLDIVVGGIPRNSVSAIITGYSIGNLDYFQNIQGGATYYSPNSYSDPNYEIAPRDNTYYSLPIIY